jgi:hypothetical protein
VGAYELFADDIVSAALQGFKVDVDADLQLPRGPAADAWLWPTREATTVGVRKELRRE